MPAATDNGWRDRQAHESLYRFCRIGGGKALWRGTLFPLSGALSARIFHESHAKARRREGNQALGEVFDAMRRLQQTGTHVNFVRKIHVLRGFAASRETSWLERTCAEEYPQ